MDDRRRLGCVVLLTTFGLAHCGSDSSTKAASTSGDAGAGPTCTGKPGAARGKTDQSVMAGGLARTFVLYEPQGLDANQGAPIVIVPHGYTMSGQQMFDITNYSAIADREKFVVAFPNGEPGAVGPWNVGNDACVSTAGFLPLATGDDQAFIDAIVDLIESDQCVDHDHVYVTGFSMGGYFSNEVGCLRPDIRAIGPHSGGTHDLGACVTTHKPVIMFHGTADSLIPETCGTQARDRWVQKNGCSTEVESKPVNGGHCEYSKGCPADGQVALCLFDGMDHGWAGGTAGQSFSFPNYESASELGWSFFKAYAW